jgi:hypothetical protein
MFSKTTPVPASDVVVPAELIPISHLALDAPEPSVGWTAYLNANGVEVVVDDVGRSAISRVAARQLFDEHREAEARKAEKRAAAERVAVEQDRRRRASIWGGVPADAVPPGVAPAAAMLQAAVDSRPRRRSVLEDALAGEGATFHPIRHDADEE